jgi:topoisomerase IA-like protein
MKTSFAKLPEGITFESLTLEEAEKALDDAKSAKEGINLGIYKGISVLRKVGPYGPYALYERAAGGAGTTIPDPIRVPIKPTDDFESICLKIETKISGDNDTRKMGCYTIKKGPYGMYCFKNDLKKPRFIKWPVDTDHKTVSESEIAEIYKAGCEKPPGKPRFIKKKRD